MSVKTKHSICDYNELDNEEFQENDDFEPIYPEDLYPFGIDIEQKPKYYYEVFYSLHTYYETGRMVDHLEVFDGENIFGMQEKGNRLLSYRQ